jgi:hypothetical protein
MVVALGTVDALPEKRPDGFSREFVLVDVAVIDGGRDEIRRGAASPQPCVCNQFPHDLIVRRVLLKLFAQPVDEAVAPEHDELPLLGADEAAGQPFGEIVGEAPVGKHGPHGMVEAVGAVVGLETAHLFERRYGAVQRQRQPAEHLQLGRRLRGDDAGLPPHCRELRIEPRHRRLQLLRRRAGFGHTGRHGHRAPRREGHHGDDPGDNQQGNQLREMSHRRGRRKKTAEHTRPARPQATAEPDSVARIRRECIISGDLWMSRHVPP